MAKKYNIPKVTILFKKWEGEPVKDTYGGKAVIDAGGEPLFAELAILKFLKAEFWTGVWVDSYSKKFRVGMPGLVGPVPFPEEKIALFDQIVGKCRALCWLLGCVCLAKKGSHICGEQTNEKRQNEGFPN